MAAGRTAPLKSFLLTQTGVAGIGNIYADEALHRAELHPLSPAGSMKPEHCEALVEGIVDALEAGLARRRLEHRRLPRRARREGLDAGRVPGPHARGQDCPRCGGTIERIVVGGPLHLLLPGMPGAAAQAAEAAQARKRRRPRRERGCRCPTASRSATGATPRGMTGCTVVLPPDGHARRRLRSRAAARGRARPTASTRCRAREDPTRGAAHRRQRLRAGRGRRRGALAGGARARPLDAGGAGADRAVGGDLRPRERRPEGAPGRRGRLRGLRGGGGRASRSAERSVSGRGATVAKVLGPRAAAARAGSATRRSRPAPARRWPRWRRSTRRRRDRRGRLAAGRARATTTARCSRGVDLLIEQAEVAGADGARGQHDPRLRLHRRRARQARVRDGRARRHRRHRPRGRPDLHPGGRRRRVLPRLGPAASRVRSPRCRSAPPRRRSPPRRSATRFARPQTA